jgi:hypothetical protein
VSRNVTITTPIRLGIATSMRLKIIPNIGAYPLIGSPCPGLRLERTCSQRAARA